MVLSMVGLIAQWVQHHREVDAYDMPKELSGHPESINLRHVQRDCACANWLILSFSGDSASGDPDKYIYVEPAYAGMDIPPSYWALADSGYVLHLSGQFYTGKAVPNNYVQRTTQKPERARVFYYNASAVVKPE